MSLKTIPDARQTYFRLISYIGRYKAAFAFGVFGAILFALAQASFTFAARPFLDGSFVEHDPRMLKLVPLGVIAIFLVRGTGDFIQTYFMAKVGRNVVKQLRGEIFERFLYLPISYFDKNASGNLLSWITFNTEQVAQAATDSVTVLVREVLTIVAMLAYLFYLSPRLTLFALIVGPLIGWLISSINRYFRRYSQRIQNSMADVTRVAKDALEAPRVIRVYNAQSHLIGQFDQVNERNRRSNMKLAMTKGLSNPTVQMIMSIALALVLYVAIRDALSRNLTVGTFVSFISSLVAITQSLRNLVNVSGPLQQGVAAAQGIFALVDEPIEPSYGAFRIERARGDVRFAAVSFAYAAGRAVALQDIELHVKPGETLAIVGRSGSGKSSLVNLLPRFYDVTSGTVSIDGRDVRDYELANLREQISLVSQDIVLFNDTIRNNIAFGRTASLAEIEKAAEAAHVLEFVRDLPEGLETIVGDRGVLLSGGQRQRIAIARALLKNAPILILDEATSALDTESERVIQAALEELMQDRTTFVIAHRLSTVEKATRIIVMEAGRIIEMGSHAELLQKGGQYATLHGLQFAE